MANLTFQILELTDPIQARFNTFILKLGSISINFTQINEKRLNGPVLTLALKLGHEILFYFSRKPHF